MSGTVLKSRPRRVVASGPCPSIREVALLGREEAAGWSPGQLVAWAGRTYTVAGQSGAGPAHLRLASRGGD